MNLTKKQADVFVWMVSFRLVNQRWPTYREAAAAFFVQVNAITQHVKAMEKKGWLRRGPARGFQLGERFQ